MGGGDFFTYVYNKKEKGRVRRLITCEISKKDYSVWSFIGTP